MLKAILHSALLRDRGVFQHLRDSYRQERHRFYRDSLYHTEWSTDGLISAVSHLSAHGNSIVCVVDALDEAAGGQDAEKSRESSLSLITSLADTPATSFRFIVLSRGTPDISRKLKHYHTIKLDSVNREDLRRVVDAGIASLLLSIKTSLSGSDEEYGPASNSTRRATRRAARRSYRSIQRKAISEEDSKCLDGIRTHLISNADGVILWPVLVLQELRHVVEGPRGFTLAELEATAKALPMELRSYYGYIIQSIWSRSELADPEMARRIFRWIISSSKRSPVRLHDLWEIMAIPKDADTGLPSPNDPIRYNHMVIHGNWNLFKRRLYEYCGPLVEVTCPAETKALYADDDSSLLWCDVWPNWTVQLFHQTVREFLTDPAQSGPLYIDRYGIEDQVNTLARTYLTLCLPLVHTKYFPREAGKKTIDYLDSHPLLNYILRHFDTFPSLPSLSGAYHSETATDTFSVPQRLDWMEEFALLASPYLTGTESWGYQPLYSGRTAVDRTGGLWGNLESEDYGGLQGRQDELPGAVVKKPTPLSLIGQLLSPDHNLRAACEAGACSAVAAILMWVKLSATEISTSLRLKMLELADNEGCPQIIAPVLGASAGAFRSLRYHEVIHVVETAARMGNTGVVRWLLDASMDDSPPEVQDRELQAWLADGEKAEKPPPWSG